MVNPDLLNFVRQHAAAGTPRETIVSMLSSGGWTRQDVEEAFAALGPTAPVQMAPVQTLTPTQPQPAQPAQSVPPLAQAAPAQPSVQVPVQPATAQPVAATPQPVPPVAVNPSPTATSAATVTPARPGWFAKWPALFGVIVLLGVIGGGSAYGYYTFIAQPQPRDILERGIAGLSGVTTYAFAATTTVSADLGSAVTSAARQVGDVPQTLDMTMAMHGVADRTSKDHPMLDTALTLSVEGKSTQTDMAVRAALNMRYLEKSLYLELTDFNASYTSSDAKSAQAQLMVAIVNGYAASLENKWVVFDLSKEAATAGPYVQTTGLSSDTSAALESYLKGMSYIQSVEQVGTEPVDGTPCYHLSVKLQNTQELLDIIRKSALAQHPELATSTAFTTQMDSLSSWLLEPMTIEVWVEEGDFRIHKAAVQGLTIHDAKTGSDLTLGEEVRLRDYNKPVTIAAPDGAQPIEELVQSLFGGFANTPGKAGAPTKGANQPSGALPFSSLRALFPPAVK